MVIGYWLLVIEFRLLFTVYRLLCIEEFFDE